MATKTKGMVEVDLQRCKGCSLCVVTCPQKVLSLHKEVNKRGYNYSFMENPDACTGCANCALVCPDGCITVYREKKQE